MPRKRSNLALAAMPAETWGDKLHRAFRIHRAETGDTYAKVVERISQVHPTHDTTLIRLESWDDVPTRAPSRLLAYFALLVYGRDPAEFGLTKDNVPLAGYDMEKVSDLLKRTSLCIPAKAA